MNKSHTKITQYSEQLFQYEKVAPKWLVTMIVFEWNVEHTELLFSTKNIFMLYLNLRYYIIDIWLVLIKMRGSHWESKVSIRTELWYEAASSGEIFIKWWRWREEERLGDLLLFRQNEISWYPAYWYLEFQAKIAV